MKGKALSRVLNFSDAFQLLKCKEDQKFRIWSHKIISCTVGNFGIKRLPKQLFAYVLKIGVIKNFEIFNTCAGLSF